MPETHIGKASDFPDQGRKVYDVDGIEFGVFRLDGEFHAYLNNCPHIDGPVCQGKILPLVIEDVRDDRTSGGRVFSKTNMNITCPWHGMEFDIRTGMHPYDKRYRLKKLKVWVESDHLYVDVPKGGSS
jgi:nitrite reductase (NADH) small subunit